LGVKLGKVFIMQLYQIDIVMFLAVHCS